MTRSLGMGRVRSGKTTTIDRPGWMHPRSGGDAIGARSASRRAAASSGIPGAKVGSTTVTRSSGRSTHNPSLPYAS
jgi:hypothetical protein